MTTSTFARRELVLSGLTLGAVGLSDRALGQLAATDETIPLWPGAIPGDRHATIVRKVDDQSHGVGRPDRWVTGVTRPMLVVRRPARPNGAAALVIPGGGYGFLSYDNEGTSQATWLNAQGVTAFILLYRLPGEGWNQRALAPLQDAQRAIRLIRARAASFAVNPDRVMALGFSAGGHLAGSLATRHAEATYAAVDATDRESARPDLAGLLYPVVSMSAAFTHAGSRDMLLGPGSTEAEREAASVELRVGPDTSPCFVVHAEDDGLVPVRNSLALYDALSGAKRPSELHLFAEGGHGFGVRPPRSMPVAHWPELFQAFATRRGLLPA